jgi:hypothetical protein
MPREDFIKQVQDALKAQKETKELEQRSDLHHDEIIKTEGYKKWTELKTEIQAIIHRVCGESGPLVYAFNDNELEIMNRENGRILKVVFEPNQAAFKYSGSGIGTGVFSPSVVNNDLAYSTERKTDGVQSMNVGTQTIAQIAEKLIKKAVGIEKV